MRKDYVLELQLSSGRKTFFGFGSQTAAKDWLAAEKPIFSSHLDAKSSNHVVRAIILKRVSKDTYQQWLFNNGHGWQKTKDGGISAICSVADPVGGFLSYYHAGYKDMTPVILEEWLKDNVSCPKVEYCGETVTDDGFTAKAGYFSFILYGTRFYITGRTRNGGYRGYYRRWTGVLSDEWNENVLHSYFKPLKAVGSPIENPFNRIFFEGKAADFIENNLFDNSIGGVEFHKERKTIDGFTVKKGFISFDWRGQRWHFNGWHYSADSVMLYPASTENRNKVGDVKGFFDDEFEKADWNNYFKVRRFACGESRIAKSELFHVRKKTVAEWLELNRSSGFFYTWGEFDDYQAAPTMEDVLEWEAASCGMDYHDYISYHE